MEYLESKPMLFQAVNEHGAKANVTRDEHEATRTATTIKGKVVQIVQ